MYEDLQKIIDKIILVVITCLTERNNNTEIQVQNNTTIKATIMRNKIN